MDRTRSHDRLSSSTHGPTIRPASPSVVVPFSWSRSSILSTPPQGAKGVLGPPAPVRSDRTQQDSVVFGEPTGSARPPRHEHPWADHEEVRALLRSPVLRASDS